MFAFALVIQQPPLSPLPPQMEPAIEAYGRCLSAETERRRPMLARKPDQSAQIFKTARKLCLAVRARSVASSEAALAAVPAFTDAARRRAFIAERFDGLDQLMRETFSGGMDPDKWGN